MKCIIVHENESNVRLEIYVSNNNEIYYMRRMEEVMHLFQLIFGIDLVLVCGQDACMEDFAIKILSK